MNIAVVVDYYPNDKNRYANGFVHTRVKAYIEKGYNTEVFVVSKQNFKRNYCYEEVKVNVITSSELEKAIFKKGQFNAIFTHMPSASIIRELLKMDEHIPIVLWLHGSSSVWTIINYPYDGYNPILNLLRFVNRLRMDLIRRFYLRKMLHRKNVHFIFVSNWMKDKTEKFLNYKFINNYSIIYNPVDNNIFKYKQRKEKIKEVICVRPHKSKKYALDLAIKAFVNSKYTLHIYGDGKYYDKNVKLAKRNKSNVIFHKKFLSQNELAELYLNYNLGLMLTRLDSQGVSACEMQMTGLPLITSEIKGNSEFKTKGMIRINNKNYKSIEDIIDKINEDPNEIEKLSKFSYENIYEKLRIDNIVEKELNILKIL